LLILLHFSFTSRAYHAVDANGAVTVIPIIGRYGGMGAAAT
jgi:hypothetical protein